MVTKWRRMRSGVGFESGEEAKCFDGLMDGHSAAVERGTSGGAGGTDKFGLQWKIDDLGDPKIAAEQSRRQRDAWVPMHAGGRGVNQAVRGCEAGRGGDTVFAEDGVAAHPRTSLRPESRSSTVIWPAPIFSMA